MLYKKINLFLFLFCITKVSPGQIEKFSHQDTLRGSIGIGRTKWDVLHYDITVTPNIQTKSISGITKITFLDSGVTSMQIDLQDPLIIDKILQDNKTITFTKEGNVYWITLAPNHLKKTNKKSSPFINHLSIFYHGIPKEAIHPPWDGGWIWKQDAKKNPLISVACQGLGASVWYPCKDTQSDEPDNGSTLHIIVPDSLIGIGNGKLLYTKKLNHNQTEFTWKVTAPINNYNIVPYIGKYKHFSEIYNGENGLLTMDYWVLSDNLEKAKKQFADVPKMMKAFEYWFGPFPFYKDGYKLVEAPHLGMEHQSAIAYGNQYQNGYLGRDLSETGWGLKWDFIIVHESGHEWFANNITTKDIADMWVHEGFTCYSETLFTEFYYGKKAGEEYVQGLRKNIINDKPIIGQYNVNNEGSEDMYYKGANLLHTIRHIIDNDSIFRDILIGLNKQFYHKTITTKDIELYFTQKSKTDLTTIFDQYLRTNQIPELVYHYKNDSLYFKWTNTIPNFAMPAKIIIDNEDNEHWISATNDWKSIAVSTTSSKNHSKVILNKNFYAYCKELDE